VKSPIIVHLVDGSELLINEELVCSVSEEKTDSHQVTILRMADGQKYLCRSPTYDEWKNDVHLRTT